MALQFRVRCQPNYKFVARDESRNVMEFTDRRSVLKTAALGTGLSSLVGTTSGETETDCGPCGQEDGGIFEATGTAGFIAINTDDPETDGYQLPDTLDEPPVTIEADYSDDGTWVATNVEFADLEPVDLGLPPVNLDFQINTPVGMSGTIDHEAGILTVEGVLEIFIPVSDVDPDQDDIRVTVAIENGTTLQSNHMIGDARDMGTASATVTIVDNEFTVPATDAVIFGIDIDELLNLPSLESGRNWFELNLDIEFTDAVPQPPAIVDGSPAKRSGIDNCYDLVTGEGSTVDILDVQTLFTNLDNPDVQDHALAYNFSGSNRERVTAFDVQALYHRLGEPPDT